MTDHRFSTQCLNRTGLCLNLSALCRCSSVLFSALPMLLVATHSLALRFRYRTGLCLDKSSLFCSNTGLCSGLLCPCFALLIFAVAMRFRSARVASNQIHAYTRFKVHVTGLPSHNIFLLRQYTTGLHIALASRNHSCRRRCES